MKTETAAQIRSFIDENFWFRGDGDTFTDEQSLLDAGAIDSTGILELVAFLESEFRLTVADADIVPENLDSVARITAYVERKLAAQSAAA